MKWFRTRLKNDDSYVLFVKKDFREDNYSLQVYHVLKSTEEEERRKNPQKKRKNLRNTIHLPGKEKNRPHYMFRKFMWRGK